MLALSPSDAAVAGEGPDTLATADRQVHLDDTVRTGRCCLYLPDPAVAVSWTVERGLP
ncbi:MAG TPA: hypothetical protein VFT68_19180 [Lapillicoccus sp.]|nr:hypothetical protein [Lapillicoccus sp.]